jgi:hypoxanthine phosphoribosyltransferase
MHENVTRVLYTEEEIATRVKELGAQISKDYAGKDLILITVLRGAFIFMADLARAIDLDIEMDFMAVSSYGAQAKSSGIVRILKDLDTHIEGRNVLLVEDILDSGVTLKYLSKNIKSRKPKSLEVVTFLLKEGKQEADVKCKYVGFECEDAFVVGYGLDYAEKYRNLPYVGVLDPKIYS